MASPSVQEAGAGQRDRNQRDRGRGLGDEGRERADRERHRRRSVPGAQERRQPVGPFEVGGGAPSRDCCRRAAARCRARRRRSPSSGTRWSARSRCPPMPTANSTASADVDGAGEDQRRGADVGEGDDRQRLPQRDHAGRRHAAEDGRRRPTCSASERAANMPSAAHHGRLLVDCRISDAERAGRAFLKSRC